METELAPPNADARQRSALPEPARSAPTMSVVDRASSGDEHAIGELVGGFLPGTEEILACGRTGTFGWATNREHAFFAVTTRRAVTMHIGRFGRFHYSDAMLEHINSSGIGQPSKLDLYVRMVIFGICTLGLANRAIARNWYRKHKAGIFLVVREGKPIVTYADGEHLDETMRLYREFSVARDRRLAELALSVA